MYLSQEFSRLIAKILHKKDENISEADKDLKEYIRLILVIARTYVRTRVEYEDLVMQGVLGLLKAREKYDETKSASFKTFASMCILGEIYTYCQSNAHLISVPTHISKAASYIDRMQRLMDTSCSRLEPIEIQKLILIYRSGLEEKLEKSIENKLNTYKDRVISIAKNSSLDYEELAALAMSSLTSTVSESLLVNFQSDSDSVESIVEKTELQDFLLESLGKKRYVVLKLHYDGYSNPEIAQILFDYDIANFGGRPITRSAVKSLLRNSISAIKKMNIFESFNGKYRDS
jgi:RNA polymerase sigma factor (sigma-70 family)